MRWQQEAGFETWNFYQSDLFHLLATGEITPDPETVDLTLKACRLPEPEFGGPDLGPRQAAYFLATGNDAAGVESDLGFGRENTNPCP